MIWSALVRMALSSLWDRRTATLLTVLSIAIGITLLSGIEKLRAGMRLGFEQTVSGAHLIVGARTTPTNLLLHSVLRIGAPTNLMSRSSYAMIAADPTVRWIVPLAVGDSHRGVPVVGTDDGFFRHYRHGDDAPLRFAAGAPFDGPDGAVLGAEAAKRLGYAPGARIVIEHEGDAIEGNAHADDPFIVTGILRPTGTPADTAIYVDLGGLSKIHRLPFDPENPMAEREIGLGSAIVGLKSPTDVFVMQQRIAGYRPEPLTAIIPGVALADLWRMTAGVEAGLLAISLFVTIVALLGIVTSILASLNERRRELVLLRTIGARPRHIFALVTIEAMAIALIGALIGLALGQALLAPARLWLMAEHGVGIAVPAPGATDLAIVAGAVVCAGLLAFLPSWRAFRLARRDGLSMAI